MHADFSPDGRWLAYTSDETGRFEVYVQAFSGRDAVAGAAGARWQVSTRGGSEPRWRRDGKELFYIGADRKLMSVTLAAGSSLEAGVPRPLFATRIPPGVSPYRRNYVPTSDGQRFLINTLLEETAATPITVVLNWPAALER